MRYTTIILSILTLIGFATISFYTNNWVWFSRSGSLLIFYAIFLEYLPTIKTKNVNDRLFWGDQEGHTSVRYSAIIVLVGTLIWGFGDLIGTDLVVNTSQAQVTINITKGSFIKVYVMPFIIPIISALGAFIIAYYTISRNEKGKTERAKIESGNEWTLAIQDAFNCLRIIKKNYFNKINSNIQNRVSTVPILNLNEKPIEKSIVSLIFIISKEEEKWNQLHFINTMLKNYNILIEKWKQLDDIKENYFLKPNQGNQVGMSERLVDLNEYCLNFTDDLIIEMYSFLTDFNRILLRNVDKKYGMILSSEMNETQSVFLKRIPEPDYNELSNIFKKPINEVKQRYDFGY
jgi:hypothetical protein